VQGYLRAERLKAAFMYWDALGHQRHMTKSRRSRMFDEYLIENFGLGATARRDYCKMVINLKNKKW